MLSSTAVNVILLKCYLNKTLLKVSFHALNHSDKTVANILGQCSEGRIEARFQCAGQNGFVNLDCFLNRFLNDSNGTFIGTSKILALERYTREACSRKRESTWKPTTYWY